MKKNDLVKFMHEHLDMSISSIDKILDVFKQGLITALKKDSELTWAGVFTIKAKMSAARDGRNPQNGAIIKIPSSIKIRCKAGKHLVDAVNSPKKDKKKK